MPLDLVPALSDLPRAEIEAHLDAVRARRMAAAIEYHHAKNAKLDHESERIQRRIKQQREMLGKEIVALDKALERVEKRLTTVESLMQEHALVGEMRVELSDEDLVIDE